MNLFEILIINFLKKVGGNMKKILLLVLFMLVGIQLYSLTPLPNNYYVKEDGIYYMNQKTEINKDTFEYVAGGRMEYVKDKKNVYYNGKIVQGADPITIEAMGLYAKDKNYVYYKGGKIKGADPDTIIVWGLYSKDKKNVYFQRTKVEKADAETFEVFLYEYERMLISQSQYSYFGKDKKNIYSGYKILESADMDTFKASDYNKAVDKNREYIADVKIED